MKLPLPPHLKSLLEAARAGSTEALGALFQAFRPYLFVLARREQRRQVRSKFGDSDLVQDTFTAAYEEFEEFRGRSPDELLTWLERILHRLSSNRVAHFKQAKRDIGREIALPGAHSPGRAREPVDTRTDSPVDLVIGQEAREATRRALLGLPETYRRVLELYYAEGETVEGIAEQLGLSVAAVRKRWVRGLPLWRAAVERELQAR